MKEQKTPPPQQQTQCGRETLPTRLTIGNGEAVSDQKHLLFLQKTSVYFQNPHGTAHNPLYQCQGVQCPPLDALGTVHTWHIHTETYIRVAITLKGYKVIV